MVFFTDVIETTDSLDGASRVAVEPEACQQHQQPTQPPPPHPQPPKSGVLNSQKHQIQQPPSTAETLQRQHEVEFVCLDLLRRFKSSAAGMPPAPAYGRHLKVLLSL